MFPCCDVIWSALAQPRGNNLTRYDSELFHFVRNASHWNPLSIMATGDSNGFGATLCLATVWSHELSCDNHVTVPYSTHLQHLHYVSMLWCNSELPTPNINVCFYVIRSEHNFYVLQWRNGLNMARSHDFHMKIHVTVLLLSKESLRVPCCHNTQRIPMRSISYEVKQLRIMSKFWFFHGTEWGRLRNYIAAWKHSDYNTNNFTAHHP